MRGTPARPEGLVYVPDLLSVEEERDLLDALAGVDLHAVVMRGQEARRTVRHFGYEYGYESWQLVEGDPLPAFLVPLRERCAALAGTGAADLAQILVTHYPAGATIGWHRDAPVFGPTVVGVSLGSECVMRFQRRASDGERLVHEQRLEPRSAYVLSGAVRSTWQHSIPAVPAPRYSVTFRTLRGRR